MGRLFYFSNYSRKLLLMLFALMAATILYTPATKTTMVTSPLTLTKSSVYSGEIENGLAQPNIAFDPPFTDPAKGPGGPILVISTGANPFSRYAVEILRAEGFNEFAAADISGIDADVLNNYDVVILGEMNVTTEQVTLFKDWVNAGGVLIAFKPCALLCPLLGISAPNGKLLDKYLLIKTDSGPGTGIVGQTIQFHGAASLHTLNGAVSIASLYSGATTAINNPAVTMMNVGVNGGKSIAFTYDLARSIIYTRQGNPAWAGQKRDGQINPIRSNDLFFGGNSPDWIDLNKIAIPQADEQQRLLANIILQSNLHRKPLPRFWYLPRDIKAAIVMTGDDHANNGTSGRFNQYLELGPNTVQDVADWKAVRATSYIYCNTPLTNKEAAAFERLGFEIALHPTTDCIDYKNGSLQNTFTAQLAEFVARFPDLSTPVTNRTHCLVWSDWSSTPKLETQKGIRLDENYYYWPEVWTKNRPGFFTGSGMPMRFADVNGSLIDTYQLPTQMSDETNMNYSAFCNEVLDKAIGAEGYYGVFCANMHTDIANHTGSNEIIASAQARHVPIISAKQMLTWLDGRNNSSFSNIKWENNQLAFDVTAYSSAHDLKAMLPLHSETGQLISVTCDNIPVDFTRQTIKGMEYAFFKTFTGTHSYSAVYSPSSAKNPVSFASSRNK